MPLLARQGNGDISGNGNMSNRSSDGFWWSSTGLAIRYSVLVIIAGCFLVFFLGGYAHARRREARGLPPLRYHAWMMRKTGYPQTPTSHYRFSRQNEQEFHMDSYPQPPPPAYNAADGPPPVYQPPPGATKVQVDQHVGGINSEGESSRRHDDTAPPHESGTQ